MQIVVELEGVLKSAMSDEPIRTGALMHASLAAHNRVTLITQSTEDKVIGWMNENKIVDYDIIIDSTVRLPDQDLFERQFNLARSRSGIELLITNNPDHWRYAFELGVSAVMFGNSSYTKPEHRPDAPKAVRAWSQIEEAVAKQNALRTEQAREMNSESIRFQ